MELFVKVVMYSAIAGFIVAYLLFVFGCLTAILTTANEIACHLSRWFSPVLRAVNRSFTFKKETPQQRNFLAIGEDFG